jgi:hypothetical protein
MTEERQDSERKDEVDLASCGVDLEDWADDIADEDEACHRSVTHCVSVIRPFLEELLRSGYSAKTVKKHAFNLYVPLDEAFRCFDESEEITSVDQAKDFLLSRCDENDGPMISRTDRYGVKQGSTDYSWGLFYRYYKGIPGLPEFIGFRQLGHPLSSFASGEPNPEVLPEATMPLQPELEHLVALAMLHNALGHLAKSFDSRMTRAEAQANMEARAILFNCSNRILTEYGCGISKADIEAAQAAEAVVD